MMNSIFNEYYKFCKKIERMTDKKIFVFLFVGAWSLFLSHGFSTNPFWSFVTLPFPIFLFIALTGYVVLDQIALRHDIN